MGCKLMVKPESAQYKVIWICHIAVQTYTQLVYMSVFIVWEIPSREEYTVTKLKAAAAHDNNVIMNKKNKTPTE